MRPSNHDSIQPSYPEDILETVRKSVKQIGKEAATHRFTPDEKSTLAEIEYTYSRPSRAICWSSLSLGGALHSFHGPAELEVAGYNPGCPDVLQSVLEFHHKQDAIAYGEMNVPLLFTLSAHVVIPNRLMLDLEIVHQSGRGT